MKIQKNNVTVKPLNEIWKEAELVEDENGDLILKFPDGMMERMGWKEGDTVQWEQLENGSWSIKRVENGS